MPWLAAGKCEGLSTGDVGSESSAVAAWAVLEGTCRAIFKHLSIMIFQKDLAFHSQVVQERWLHACSLVHVVCIWKYLWLG